MEYVLLLILLLVVVVAMVASRFIDSGNPFPVQKKTSLFSPVERSFMQLLEKASISKFSMRRPPVSRKFSMALRTRAGSPS